MIFYCPEKMPSELLNDPKYDKNQKKPMICLLDAAAQSQCRACAEDKLCTTAISLVLLHIQTGQFMPSYKKHIVTENK